MPNHLKVIPFPRPPSDGNIKWKFFDYGTEIETWYQTLSETEQDTFNALLKANGKAETPDNWTGWKFLKGEVKKEKIWEWRFHSDGVQQRLLGIFGPKRREATFVIGCNHKQNVYKPPDCLKTASKRAREVREGKVQLNERQVRTDL